MRYLVSAAALLVALAGCGSNDREEAGDGPSDGAPATTTLGAPEAGVPSEDLEGPPILDLEVGDEATYTTSEGTNLTVTLVSEPSILKTGYENSAGVAELDTVVGIELRVENGAQVPAAPSAVQASGFIGDDGRVYGFTGITGPDGCIDLPEADLSQGQFAEGVECYEVTSDGGFLLFQEEEMPADSIIMGNGFRVAVPPAT